MNRQHLPESWVGRRVKVKLRTEGGGGYWILGQLRAVTDEGIELSPQFRTDNSGSESRPKRPEFYPWRPISDVRLLEGGR